MCPCVWVHMSASSQQQFHHALKVMDEPQSAAHLWDDGVKKNPKITVNTCLKTAGLMRCDGGTIMKSSCYSLPTDLNWYITKLDVQSVSQSSSAAPLSSPDLWRLIPFVSGDGWLKIFGVMASCRMFKTLRQGSRRFSACINAVFQFSEWCALDCHCD